MAMHADPFRFPGRPGRLIVLAARAFLIALVLAGFTGCTVTSDRATVEPFLEELDLVHLIEKAAPQSVERNGITAGHSDGMSRVRSADIHHDVYDAMIQLLPGEGEGFVDRLMGEMETEITSRGGDVRGRSITSGGHSLQYVRGVHGGWVDVATAVECPSTMKIVVFVNETVIPH